MNHKKTCNECGQNRGFVVYSYWSTEKDRFVSSCNKCVNKGRHWHGSLNHSCDCFDDGITLP